MTKIKPLMICDENYDLKTSLFGVSYLFALFVSNIFITPFGDVLGRRRMNMLACGMQTVCLLAISLSLSTDKTNYYAMLAMTFSLGLFSAPRYNTSMIYANELSIPKYNKLLTFLMNIALASFGIAIGIYFYYVKSVVPLMYFLTVLHVYVTI